MLKLPLTNAVISFSFLRRFFLFTEEKKAAKENYFNKYSINTGIRCSQ